MTTALKEWAIVCRALDTGRQIMLARKGGIAEGSGDFQVEHSEFFLFPTYLHQDRDLLKPTVHFEFDLVAAQEPRDGKLHLSNYAHLTDQIRVTDEAVLKRLAPHHIGTDKVLLNRFTWGSAFGLTLLILRVYRLPTEISLPMKKEYGGCRSWVTLDRKIPTIGASPVLSDSEFFRKREWLKRQLGSS